MAPTPKRSLDQWHESMVNLQILIDDLQCELAATLDEEVSHGIRNRLQLLYAEREALFTTTEDWLEHYR